MLNSPRLVASLIFPIVLALLAFSNGIGLPWSSASPATSISPSPSPTALASAKPLADGKRDTAADRDGLHLPAVR